MKLFLNPSNNTTKEMIIVNIVFGIMIGISEIVFFTIIVKIIINAVEDYKWNKQIDSEHIIMLVLVICIGCFLGYSSYSTISTTTEANELTDVVLKKSTEYTNLKNIDLSGKTIFDTYILLISEGMIENQADSVVIKEMCFDKGSQKVIVKNKNNNVYEVVPKTE